MIRLPQEFTEKMKGLLGAEYEAFWKSYEGQQVQALRVNTGKLTPRQFQEMAPFTLRPVPWAAAGFYYEKEERPGRHPWHEAGLYYIQEPSAMAVGEMAAPRPGEWVLDLCAAPGGKTTHLAALMEGRGFLASNEIHPGRAKILSSNVERMGIANAVVFNETPERLSERFPGFFDRVVVDAPCSGEGMFRKEEQALIQWSLENVERCALRQQEILCQAARLLRPGGRLVYSTCTFAPEEDEGSIARFLQSHPDFSVKRMEPSFGFAPGHPEWAGGEKETAGTLRLWPHRLEGEGHYIAVLEKKAGAEAGKRGAACSVPMVDQREAACFLSAADRQQLRLYEEFAEENLKRKPQGVPIFFGEQLYLLPQALPLKGLKVLRAGLHLGTVKKNRFEPSHALALALEPGDARRVYRLEGDSGEAAAYLRGEALARSGEKGWTLVLVDGFPLGWGKQGGGILKNHYPKGLRKG